MGYLHDDIEFGAPGAANGLGREARHREHLCQPTQFGPREDLKNYPRDLARDNSFAV